jgi:hypothetical protein
MIPSAPTLSPPLNIEGVAEKIRPIATLVSALQGLQL